MRAEIRSMLEAEPMRHDGGLAADNRTEPGFTVLGGLRADDSYARLLGPDAWARLAPEIQKRFSVRPGARARISYFGESEVRRSRLGCLLAHLCRLIGTPVAPHAGKRVPVTVELLADPQGGICWRRNYYFAPGRPLRVRSSKRLNAEGHLEEHLGGGLAMRLAVFERDGNLHFLSRDYHWRLGPLSLRLPAWLSPGTTEVVHEQVNGRRFRFMLRVTHPWFGELYLQDGVYRSRDPRGFSASPQPTRTGRQMRA